MAGFRWTIDRRRLASKQVHAAAAAGLSDAAEFLLEQSNRTAPIEEGTLVRSGQADVDVSALRAAVAYDTPYAARQHEDLTLRHDAGRRPKWLEQTMRETTGDIGRIVADRIRQAVR
jgi:hypothetical protein